MPSRLEILRIGLLLAVALSFLTVAAAGGAVAEQVTSPDAGDVDVNPLLVPSPGDGENGSPELPSGGGGGTCNYSDCPADPIPE